MRFFKSILVPGNEVQTLIRHGHNGSKNFRVTFDDNFSMNVTVHKDELQVTLFNSHGTKATEERIPGTDIAQDFKLENGDDHYEFSIVRGAFTSITQADVSTYRKEGGVRCPFCRTDDIHAGRVRNQGEGIIVQQVECTSCLASWTDEYQLIQIVTSGDDAWEGPTANVVRNDTSEES